MSATRDPGQASPCPHGPDHREPPRLDTIPLDDLDDQVIFAEKWNEANAWIQINTDALVEVGHDA